MRTTPKSLSVVVPVHNAERTLAQHIGRLLEVLPDLAARFEVLIVDDGSTDQTEEVAIELSSRYPQVRVTRHQQQRGIEASAQTGATHTTGDVVIVHAGQVPVNASQLQQIWQHREDEDLVVAPIGSDVFGVNSKVLRQLEEWGSGVADERAPRTAPPLRRGPKKLPVPPPMFRNFSADSRSSMHQKTQH